LPEFATEALREEADGMDAGEKGTISIHLVHEALVGVRQRGIDVELLLAQAGISPVLLDSAQARVSPANYGMLWNLIAQALDDEFFDMDSHPMKSEASRCCAIACSMRARWKRL
jgi:hypothetical protein